MFVLVRSNIRSVFAYIAWTYDQFVSEDAIVCLLDVEYLLEDI